MSSLAKRLQPLIGIIISVLLVYLVVFSPHLVSWSRGEINLLEALFGDPRIGLEDLRAAYDRILIWPAVMAVGLLIGSLFLRAWRWRLILRQIGPTGYWTVFHGTNLGYLLNNVLPLRAGEFLRGVIVARRESLSTTAVLTTVAAERVFDMAGLGIVFGLTAFLFPFPDWVQTGGLTVAAAIIVLLGIALMLAHSRDRTLRLHRALDRRRNKVVRTLGELVLRLVDGLAVLRSPLAMLHVAWSTMALWVIYITVMKLTLDAFQFSHGAYPGMEGQAWLPATILTVITALGFAVPSAPGGVGTYHGAVLLGLSWFDVSEGLGVIFATVMHAMNYITLTLMGVISLFAAKLRFSDLVKTARDRHPSLDEKSD